MTNTHLKLFELHRYFTTLELRQRRIVVLMLNGWLRLMCLVPSSTL
jgi:hypothetical protein